jgi:alkylation response protein AidB-like acyl-CoA dehydrogenase
MLIITY